MTAHRVKGNRIDLPSGKTACFAFTVAEVVEVGDTLVVRLEVPPGAAMNRNVFGISAEDGRVLWQVPERNFVYEDSPYVGVRRDGDLLALYNWDGLKLRVVPQTGEVLEELHGR